MGCFMRIGTLVVAFPVSFTLSLNSANRKEQPMEPFARINLSSVLSSVALAKGEALAKGDALRRGSGKCCQCENIQCQ